MKIHNLFALFVAGSLLHPGTGAALEPRDIFKAAEPSIVVVLASGAKDGKNIQGSGVMLAPLEILTSCKLIESAADIVVSQANTLRIARLRYKDAARDLCQLHIEDALPAAKPALIAESSLSLESGQDVFTISSPQGMERTISRGMISGLKETQGGSGRLIQLDTIMGPGSRGGGVFDDKANLVGIVTPQFKQAEGTSYALPVEWISELAKRGPDLTVVVASTSPSAAAKPADDAPKDDRWRPMKGDRWSYRLIDGKRTVGKVSIEVVESTPGRVRERITKDGSPGFSFEREVRPEFSPQAFQAAVQLPGGYKLFELSSYFPPESTLESGKRLGQIPGEMYLLNVGKRNLVWETKVGGQEQVRVPAGEFKAWRIDAVASEVTVHGPLKIYCQIWYSEAMRRAVKISLRFDTRIDIANSQETLELAGFDKAN